MRKLISRWLITAGRNLFERSEYLEMMLLKAEGLEKAAASLSVHTRISASRDVLNSAVKGNISHATLKVLTNEKRGGLNLESFDWSRCKLFRAEIQKNLCRTYPVRGLKLLIEPCFYHLKSIIVSQ
jgi:hypothetical protein